MKICFPVQRNEGLESEVYNHFGSAPMFIVVDTGTKGISEITNRDEHHAHGACNPIMALGSQAVDAVIVGGIGGGALSRLNESGIKVYQAGASSIRENITMFMADQLPQYNMQQCCGGNARGCGHHSHGTH